MEARVAIMEAKPGELGDLVGVFDAGILTAIRAHEGNAGFLLLSDPDTNRAIAVSLWDTKEEADASDSIFGSVAPELQRHLTHAPGRETFDVTIAAVAESGITP